MNHYFNSTNENGQSLKEYQGKAIKQDQAILEVFKDVGGEQTAESIHARLKLIDTKYLVTPLTSIRRAINTLWNKEVISKVGQKIGGYGRPVDVYKLG